MRANLNSGFGQIKRTLSRIYVFIPISKKSFCSVILFSCYFSSFRPSKARSIYFSFFANKILQGLDCLSCDDATSFFCKLGRTEILDVKRDSIGLKYCNFEGATTLVHKLQKMQSKFAKQQKRSSK